MFSISVHTVVSLYIMNAQHVTIDLINMFFVGGTHSEVGIVSQHAALDRGHDQRRAIIGARFFGCAKSQQKVVCMGLGPRAL